MRYITSIFLLLVVVVSPAQEILIKDQVTGKPLFNVAIYNESKSNSTVSSPEGKANLSQFGYEEVLFFSHISHLSYSTTKGQILQNSSLVLLRPDENELEEVVVSTSRFRQLRRDLPQKIVSLSREDILQFSPQTSADLLENSGQVYVQKSQLGGGSPMIRGFATNRLLLTVDGVRMNTAIFRGGNVQNVISIDPMIVEQTEVIMGPGSVIYGSDAVGGVMNFYTLTPNFSYSDNTLVSGRAYARYATANNEKTGHFDVSIGGKKWALASSLSYSDFDDLMMGSHGPDEYLRNEYAIRQDNQDFIVQNKDPKLQKPTGYNQLSLMEKLRFKPNETWDFSLGLHYSTTSDYPRFDRLYRKRDGELRTAQWYYGPQQWLKGNFQAHHRDQGAFYDEVRLVAAYQFFKESRHNRDFDDIWLFHNEEKVDVWSANLDFEKGIGNHKLHYGLEYVINKVGSKGSEENINNKEERLGVPRYPDGSTWESMAAYGSFKWKLSPALALQTGARYNLILLDASFDQSLYDFPFQEADIQTGSLTGSAGLSWQQNKLLNWKLNLSTAFRAPNIDDIGKIFDSAPGMVVVPNPHLKPEYAYNAELGVRFNLEDIVIIDLAGYYTWLEDAMVRRDYSLDGREYIDYQGETSRVQAIQNAAHAEVYGLEAGAQVQLANNLSLKARINITQGEEELDDGTKAPLRHAAPVFGNAHLTWKRGKLTIDFSAEYNGEIQYDELAPSEQDKAYLYAIDENGNPYAPQWHTLNLNSNYQVTDSWLASISLENITDQRYRTYSSGLTAPGRNLIIALQYSF